MDAILRWLTDASLAEAIVGDLLEERHRRAAVSRVAAAVWFWRRVLAVAAYVLAARVGAAARRAAAAFHGGSGSAGRDVRQALRATRHAPWYSLAVVGVLALGMALATTAFAVVDGILFKPLPYPRATELVAIRAGFRAVDSTRAASASDVAAWREAMPDAAFTIFRTSSSARFEDVNDLPFGVAEVQSNLFDVIGVPPLMGGFAPEHYADESNIGETMISYELWQSRFGGAPDILGRRIVRGTASMEIVGVLPPGFVFPARRKVQVLMPLRLSALERTSLRSRGFEVIARLPPAVPLQTARRRIEAAMASVGSRFPPPPPLPPGKRWPDAQLMGPFERAFLHPLDEWLSEGPRPLFLAVFLSAAAIVLLACVNVSGLMAARSLDRRREIALRRALGAGAARIATLVLAEASVLAAAGTLAGVALATPFLRIVLDLLPPDVTLLKNPAIDWRVAAFVALATLVAVAGISVWPIRRGVGANDRSGPDDGIRGLPRVRSRGRLVVISSQVAIGLVLTLCGSLLVGSLVRLWQDDIGIDPQGVLAIELRVPATAAEARPGGVNGILDRILERTRSISGGMIVGATDAPLLRNSNFADLGWRPPAEATGSVYLNVHGITSGFFDVVRPRLLAGRLPSNEELDAGRRVIVVSESVARAFWPSEVAVGQDLEYTGKNPGPFSVVGVVADARFAAWDDSGFHQLYAPRVALERDDGSVNVLIRTTGAAGRILGDMERFMAAEGPDVRAIRAMTLADMLADSVRPRRLQSWLFGSFAVAALAIVGVGILGLMAMTAARRTREIGIRMALGATRDGVVLLFVREQFVAVAGGVLTGGFVSIWAVEFVRAYLYELTPYDARVWAAAVLLIVATAALGTLVPALRASRVDPATTLRVE